MRNSPPLVETLQRSRRVFAILAVFLLAVVCLLSVPVSAAEMWAGEGTEENPYQISTVADLQNLATQVNGGESFAGKYFTLMNDLDLSDVCGEGIGNWVPIGNIILEGATTVGYEAPFSGVFAGSGHIVSGMYINSNTWYQGLFGFTKDAIIEDITVSGVITSDIDSGSSICNIGGLIGYSENCTVVDCCSMVGIDCGGYSVGGLIGSIGSSSVSSSYSLGEVQGGECVGGLVGSVGLVDFADSSVLSNSYATGTVSGNYCVGGLVGSVASSLSQFPVLISNCYSSGEVCGSKGGGLIGEVFCDTFDLTSCYSTGDVSGNNNVAGLIGFLATYNSINSCYRLETATVNGEIISDYDLCHGKAAPQDYLVDQGFLTVSLGWDFDTVWEMNANGYPVLKNLPTPPVPTPPASLTLRVSTVADGELVSIADGSVEITKPVVFLVDGTYLPEWGLVNIIIKTPSGNTLYSYDALPTTQIMGAVGTGNWVADSLSEVGTYTAYAVSSGDETIKSPEVTFEVIDQIPIDLSELGIQGLGTGMNPYMISTAEQLETLAEVVDDGYSFNDQYFCLVDDIDLSAYENWHQIGSFHVNTNYQDSLSLNSQDASLVRVDSFVPFSGVFDGCGYTISGLKIQEDGQHLALRGLFGCLNEGATLKNIHLTDVYCEEGEFVGGLVGGIYTGYVDYSGSIVIENCSVDGTCIGDGGLIGRINSGSANSDYIAIQDCSATVEGSLYGGLIGQVDIYNGGTVLIKGCHAKVDVENNELARIASYVDGGLIGSVTQQNEGVLIIQECSAEVNGETTGGLIRSIDEYGSDYISILNCFASADKCASGSLVESIRDLSNGYMYAAEGKVKVSTSYFLVGDTITVYSSEYSTESEIISVSESTEDYYKQKGWDFDTVWEIGTMGHPVLKSLTSSEDEPKLQKPVLTIPTSDGEYFTGNPLAVAWTYSGEVDPDKYVVQLFWEGEYLGEWETVSTGYIVPAKNLVRSGTYSIDVYPKKEGHSEQVWGNVKFTVQKSFEITSPQYSQSVPTDTAFTVSWTEAKFNPTGYKLSLRDITDGDNDDESKLLYNHEKCGLVTSFEIPANTFVPGNKYRLAVCAYNDDVEIWEECEFTTSTTTQLVFQEPTITYPTENSEHYTGNPITVAWTYEGDLTPDRYAVQLYYNMTYIDEWIITEKAYTIPAKYFTELGGAYSIDVYPQKDGYVNKDICGNVSVHLKKNLAFITPQPFQSVPVNEAFTVSWSVEQFTPTGYKLSLRNITNGDDGVLIYEHEECGLTPSFEIPANTFTADHSYRVAVCAYNDDVEIWEECEFVAGESVVYGGEALVKEMLNNLSATGSELGYTDEWCAYYIGDCAERVGLKDIIPKYGKTGDLLTGVFGKGGKLVCFNYPDGLSGVTYPEDFPDDKVQTVLTVNGNEPRLLLDRSSYIPKVGDIIGVLWDKQINKWTINHVEVITEIDGDIITSVSGNSGSGNEPEERSVNLHKFNWKDGRRIDGGSAGAGTIVAYARPNYPASVNPDCTHTTTKEVPVIYKGVSKDFPMNFNETYHYWYVNIICDECGYVVKNNLEHFAFHDEVTAAAMPTICVCNHYPDDIVWGDVAYAKVSSDTYLEPNVASKVGGSIDKGEEVYLLIVANLGGYEDWKLIEYSVSGTERTKIRFVKADVLVESDVSIVSPVDGSFYLCEGNLEVKWTVNSLNIASHAIRVIVENPPPKLEDNIFEIQQGSCSIGAYTYEIPNSLLGLAGDYTLQIVGFDENGREIACDSVSVKSSGLTDFVFSDDTWNFANNLTYFHPYLDVKKDWLGNVKNYSVKWEDISAVYGDNEAAKAIWENEVKSNWGGSCFGMVASLIAVEKNVLPLDKFTMNKETYSHTFAVPMEATHEFFSSNAETLGQFIMQVQMFQGKSGVQTLMIQNGYNYYGGDGYAFDYDKLEKCINDEGQVLIGMSALIKSSKTGGHALIGYAVREITNYEDGTSIALLSVYDPNYPGNNAKRITLRINNEGLVSEWLYDDGYSSDDYALMYLPSSDLLEACFNDYDQFGNFRFMDDDELLFISSTTDEELTVNSLGSDSDIRELIFMKSDSTPSSSRIYCIPKGEVQLISSEGGTAIITDTHSSIEVTLDAGTSATLTVDDTKDNSITIDSDADTTNTFTVTYSYDESANTGYQSLTIQGTTADSFEGTATANGIETKGLTSAQIIVEDNQGKEIQVQNVPSLNSYDEVQINVGEKNIEVTGEKNGVESVIVSVPKEEQQQKPNDDTTISTGSGSSTSSSVILTEPATPTPTPSEGEQPDTEPTQPAPEQTSTPTETPKSPAPVVGTLFGLLILGLILRRRQ